MIQAAVRNNSYREGSRELAESAELAVDAKKLERAVRRIGGERLAERDAKVATWQELSLAQQQRGCPSQKLPPQVAVVQFDCGRLLVRERERKSARGGSAAAIGVSEVAGEVAVQTAARLAEDEAACQAEEASAAPAAETVPGDKNRAPEACRSRFWRDDKVGVLLNMQSAEQDQDPCPEIPASFVDPQRTLKLVQELGGSCPSCERPPEPGGEAPAESARPGAPQPLVKSIVASRSSSVVFGAILAAAAWWRGFAGARRKAFLADGAAMNWTLWARFFSHYVPILDFIHALQYVFAAAIAGRAFSEGWAVYCRWIEAVWSGGVGEVIAELLRRQAELGLAPPDAPATDPRCVVAAALRYLQTHRSRMDYARYRRLGLPIMTAYVESAVKQIGRRVKGTEKFWCEVGAEAILQLRADYLSDTSPLDSFWGRRKERATGQRSHQRTARAPSNHCAA